MWALDKLLTASSVTGRITQLAVLWDSRTSHREHILLHRVKEAKPFPPEGIVMTTCLFPLCHHLVHAILLSCIAFREKWIAKKGAQGKITRLITISGGYKCPHLLFLFSISSKVSCLSLKWIQYSGKKLRIHLSKNTPTHKYPNGRETSCLRSI